jgi:hypothetical protein
VEIPSSHAADIVFFFFLNEQHSVADVNTQQGRKVSVRIALHWRLGWDPLAIAVTGEASPPKDSFFFPTRELYMSAGAESLPLCRLGKPAQRKIKRFTNG